MASIVLIDSIANGNYTNQVKLSLDGVATGTLTFRIARAAVEDASEVAPHTLDGGYYYIEVPHPGLWFVWVRDDNGYSVTHEAIVTANDAHLDVLGEKLKDILVANKKGLEAYMRFLYPNITLRQIVYGNQSDVSDWPAVLITNPISRTGRAFFPFGSETIYSYTIETPVVHETEESERRLATRLAVGVQKILNMPYYQDIVLDNGTPINLSWISDVRISEFQTSERLVASGVLEWAGNGLLQDPGGC